MSQLESIAQQKWRENCT